MTVLIFSTQDFRGGAGRMSYMISKGLIKNGDEVLLYVKNKEREEDWITKSKTSKLRFSILHILEKIPTTIGEFFSRPFPFTPGLFGENIDPIIEEFKPDLILFTWTWKGFISFKKILEISQKYKVFWRVADWSPFADGVYFPYTDFIHHDLSELHPIHRFFINALHKYRSGLWNKHTGDLTFITPSQYLKKQATKDLDDKYNIEVISNGLDTDLFKPRDKEKIKKELGLDPNKTYIMFGALNYFSGPTKGGKLILEITKKLSKILDPSKIAFMTFGVDDMEKHLPHLAGFDATHFGYVSDPEQNAKLFAAADLAMFTSKQESFSLVVLQYLTCLTPVVAFDVGAISELVVDGENGYLIDPFNVEDYVEKVLKALDSKIVFDFDRDDSYERMTQDFIRVFTQDSSHTKDRS